MEENLKVTRDAYLTWRQNQDKDQILRAYFNLISKMDIDYENFMIVYLQVMDEYPGLEEDINNMYSGILNIFDKMFHLTFVTIDKEKVIKEEVKETKTVLLKIL